MGHFARHDGMAARAMPSPRRLGLELAADLVEDGRDLRAKQEQRANDHDGDQGDDESVLYEALATGAAEHEIRHSGFLQALRETGLTPSYSAPADTKRKRELRSPQIPNDPTTNPCQPLGYARGVGRTVNVDERLRHFHHHLTTAELCASHRRLCALFTFSNAGSSTPVTWPHDRYWCLNALSLLVTSSHLHHTYVGLLKEGLYGR